MEDPTLDQLEGKVRYREEGEWVILRFVGRTVKRLQEQLDAGTLDELLAEAGSMSPETLSRFYWAAALWERPDLTLEQVEEMHLPYQPTLNAVHDVLGLYFYGPPREADASEEDANASTDPPEDGRGATH